MKSVGENGKRPAEVSVAVEEGEENDKLNTAGVGMGKSDKRQKVGGGVEGGAVGAVGAGVAGEAGSPAALPAESVEVEGMDIDNGMDVDAHIEDGNGNASSTLLPLESAKAGKY
jgi:hypothetical protein